MIKQQITKIKKTIGTKRKKIIEWKDKICMKTDKKEIERNSIKNKSFEELILEKDEQNSFISIKIPIFISIAWMVIWVIFTALTSVNLKILRQDITVLNTIITILKVLFMASYIIILLRLLTIITNIIEEQNIVSKNIKIYDWEIFKRLKEYEKEKIALLEEIRDNIKQKIK